MKIRSPAFRKSALQRLMAGIVPATNDPRKLRTACSVPIDAWDQASGAIIPERDTYRKVTVHGMQYPAHSLVLALAEGAEINDELLCRHTCDHPCCRSPLHLQWGTSLDNKTDEILRGRVARGERNGAHTRPESRPRGEKHRGATITAKVAGEVKWLIAHFGKRRGSTPSIAAAYNTSAAVVNGIRNGGSWAKVPSTKPERIPRLILRQKTRDITERGRFTILTPAQVSEIRYKYQAAENIRHLKRSLAQEFHVSVKTIRDILERRTHKNIAPEIPAINERGHGMAVLSDKEVQEARATFAAYTIPGCMKGLRAVLARHFRVSQTHLARILERESRTDVKDDKNAVIPRKLLPWKVLNHCGEQHANVKMTEERVRSLRADWGACNSDQERNSLITSRAQQWGVTRSNLRQIAKRKTWTHV